MKLNFAPRIYRRTWILINLISISLKIFGFNRSKNILIKLSKLFPNKNNSDPIKQGLLFAKIVNKVSKYSIFRCKCLEVSMATWFLCSRSGIDCEFKIGTMIENNILNAHAWVEINNEVITEYEDPRLKYVAFNNKKIL